MRPAIHPLVYRILPIRAKVRRLDHHGFHDKAVSRLDLQELGLRVTELVQRRDPVGIDQSQLASVGVVHACLRRRVHIAPAIEIERKAGAEIGRVGAVSGRKALQPCAVELDAIDILADVAAFGAGEVNPSVLLVHAVDDPDFPGASGDGTDCRPVFVMQVQMPPTRSLAEPQKRTVLQPDWIAIIVLTSDVATVDPGFAGFPKQRPGRSGRAVGRIEIEPALFTVLHLVHNRTAIGLPADIDNEEIGARTWRYRPT